MTLSTLPLLTNDKTRHFFQAVIDAAANKPEYDWVIAIGNKLNVDEFFNVTSNIVLVNRAPQLELLKKASLMITHGGPSSIKECIYFGVPMIAFPLWFDQTGNVARLKYHGLGIEGKFDQISKDYLLKLLSEALYNSELTKNTKRMQNLFHQKEREKSSVQIIEDFLI